jgi:Domain of unknown function (DUF4160)
VHIHVQRERCLAKFWLSPLSLASSKGFSSSELSKLHVIVRENASKFMEAWHEFFSSSR